MNQANQVTPQIYVACLAAYNNGKLYGRWLDANQDTHAIHAEISVMLSESPEPFAEEWAVHDYEGFSEIELSEWPDLARVSQIAGLLAEHGEAFGVWYQSQDGQHVEVSELEEKFLEQWQGAFDSDVDFACELLENTGALSELPEWAKNYFNFEGYARDLALSGDYAFIRHECKTYVFSNF